MRGRESEARLIDEMLRRGRTGTGGVILVEGEPGMGKSLLLSEAAKAAAAQGYTTVTAVADEFERMIPLCPLLLALGDVMEPGDDLPDIAVADPRLQAVDRARRCLERLTAHGPVLVTVDDLQHADPVTLLSLRVLPRQLASRPLSWVLARSAGQGTDAARLFDLLDHDGADRLVLGPLPAQAIAGLITDLLGVAADSSLLSLAGGTGGNPLLVGELLRGLREESLPATAAERLPQRVRTAVTQWLGSFRPQTRQLVEVSAVLGRSFAVEDVAEMLGQPPAVVLPAISEALAAGIIVPAGESLRFRDAVAWRAITQALPESVSRALHRQFGQLLLDRGDALQAAAHLVSGARQGDGRVLSELDRAAREALCRSPRTAAGLAARALELTAPDDPARPGRTVSAVAALLASRRPREAAELIEVSLTMPLPDLPRAQLRCARVSVLLLSGQPGQARAAAEDLLAEPGLPAGVRDDTMIALLHALGELPDLAAAQQRAESVISHAAQPRRAGPPGGAVVAAAKALQATVEWNQGHIAASLRLSREATGHGPARPRYRAVLELAGRLISAGLPGEAAALLSTPCEDEDAASLALAQSGPALLRARIHLAAGRLGQAASDAETALGSDAAGGADPHTVLAWCVLGAIGLRRGDLIAAGEAVDAVSARLAEAGSGRAGILSQILAAQVADARHGPAAAMSGISGLYDQLCETRWPLIHDPAVPAWLVRLALAAGERERAAAAAGAAADLGRHNPGFPVVTAACAHARGLLTGDIDLLRQAAQTQPDAWAAASAAADLAAVLAAAGRASEAVEWLDHAYGNFLASGAGRDAARVRGMLRGLGVRRRQSAAADDATQRAGRGDGHGLGSLTETERGIAELACQGLTNRQIAERTFVSANTVAFHLRNIYRKLRIPSRVQLARLMLESRPPAV